MSQTPFVITTTDKTPILQCVGHDMFNKKQVILDGQGNHLVRLNSKVLPYIAEDAGGNELVRLSNAGRKWSAGAVVCLLTLEALPPSYNLPTSTTSPVSARSCPLWDLSQATSWTSWPVTSRLHGIGRSGMVATRYMVPQR